MSEKFLVLAERVVTLIIVAAVLMLVVSCVLVLLALISRLPA